MNTAWKTVGRTLILALVSGLSLAQQPSPSAAPATSAPAPRPSAAGSSAQIDAGEPRANSAPSMADAPTQATPNPVAAVAPVTGTGRGSSKSVSQPRAPGAAGAVPASRGSPATDRVNLNTATVTGDREQPKVMYIVPWKSTNIGDLSGKPMNSLLDEALAPVDREEFKRELTYYDALRANAPQNGATTPAAKQGEK